MVASRAIVLELSLDYRRMAPTLVVWIEAIIIVLPPVVQKVDNAIQRVNHCPLDNAISFPNTYPLDSDLSGG